LKLELSSRWVEMKSDHQNIDLVVSVVHSDSNKKKD